MGANGDRCYLNVPATKPEGTIHRIPLFDNCPARCVPGAPISPVWGMRQSAPEEMD
jgi:hypothetical protein